MDKFLTILAIIFLIGSVIRIIGIYYGASENAELVRFVEKLGGNPVGEALKWPVIILLVCAAWLISLIW